MTVAPKPALSGDRVAMNMSGRGFAPAEIENPSEMMALQIRMQAATFDLLRIWNFHSAATARRAGDNRLAKIRIQTALNFDAAARDLKESLK